MKRLALIGLALVCAAASASAQQSTPVKDEVPAEYKPPKGMCRIWLKDVAPKQQPAPTDCAAAVKNVPQNGRVIFGDPVEEKKTTRTEVPKDAKGFSGKSTPPPVVIKKPPVR